MKDIERSLHKLMDPRSIEVFHEIYAMSDPKDAKENLKQAMKRISNILKVHNKSLTRKREYHWIVVSHYVRISGTAILKKYGIDTLSNVKLEKNGTVILTSLQKNGGSFVKYILQGCANYLDFEDKIVAWNIETEAQFCALDAKRMMILGYRAIFEESETKDEDEKWRLGRTSLRAQARRWKFVMKLLGDHGSEHYSPTFPKQGDPYISEPTDYEYVRAGSRGKRFDDFGDHYDLFFNDTQKTLTEKGKKLFWGSGGPAGSFIQRSFKVRHQYQQLLDQALDHWAIDNTEKIIVNEEKYNQWSDYTNDFQTIYPNGLANWQIQDVIYTRDSALDFTGISEE